jgi:hypothetical protein
MEKAKRTDIFFKNIRLFSIAINTEKIIIRIHQTNSLTEENNLIFLYDDLCTLYKYNKDDTCLFIRSIFIKYGIAELHGVFKIIFKKISKQYNEKTHQNN